MDALGAALGEQEANILATREEVRRRRTAHGYVDFGAYPINRLEAAIHFHDVELAFIDRARFGADFAVTVPRLLKEKGNRAYIADVAPALVAQIQGSPLCTDGTIERVEQQGIYVNVKLSDRFLIETIAAVGRLGDQYGESDVYEEREAVVDYSSPNVAKHLHAGHVRSTIGGHVLANIYEAVGFTVHRDNHIDDWGGLGVLLEGYRRFKDRMGEFHTRNDFLYFIYREYRVLEEAAEASAEGRAAFEEFRDKAKQRFRDLESGEEATVDLWRQMIGWSLEEYEKFYALLNIHHDYVVGDSFYARRGEALVGRAIRAGKTEDEEGGTVVRLGDDERAVIRRADGSTIYMTRDLATIEFRLAAFDPATIVYVVGQEQTDHFSKLFRTAEALGLLAGKDVALKHLPLGFYVNAETKKKIASREGATGVAALIEAAVAHFRAKYDASDIPLTPEEKDANAWKLAIGSLAFHDVKKDRRIAVEFSSDMKKVIAEFETSGGAYLMYTSARARSIVRKYDGPVPQAAEVNTATLAEPEVVLIKMINDFPRLVLRAAETDNPAVIAGYLLDMARAYNGYYENYPVLAGAVLAHPHRLVLTCAVARVIDNGLRMLHAEGPERI